MTLCPNTRGAQCCCQPDDGVQCPHGPTPERVAEHMALKKRNAAIIDMLDDRPRLSADDDQALTIAYMKGRSDERALCIRVVQQLFDKWDGPWKNAAEFMAAAIGSQDTPKAGR